MQDYVEQLTNAGKTSFESLQELGTINAKALQKLAELQFKFASYNIETGIEQTKLLTGTTNYKDLLTAESDFAGEYSSKAMDFTREAGSILTESREEIVSWFEKEWRKQRLKPKHLSSAHRPAPRNPRNYRCGCVTSAM